MDGWKLEDDPFRFFSCGLKGVFQGGELLNFSGVNDHLILVFFSIFSRSFNL